MNGQRGSVLAGVMGLSVVLTLAGMSYILVLSHSQSQEENLLREFRLRNAAESALIVGTRHAMEAWPYTFYNVNAATTHLITADWVEMNGARVRMFVDRRVVPSLITCFATLPEGSDTLKLTWAVDSAVDATTCPPSCPATTPPKPASIPFLTRLVLKNWTESIIPYRRSP